MILSLLIPLSALALVAELPAPFLEAEGKTFAYQGPNCFATALKLTGVTQSFRGMDELEFRELTQLYCERTESPRIGDIGVFEKPGFGFIHAYAYVSPEFGLEKPGVDYMGKTPIALARMESIQFRYLAPIECRRYSPGDLSQCANDHYFLRCNPVHFSGQPQLRRHEQKIRDIELGLDQLLEQTSADSDDHFLFDRLEQATGQASAEVASIHAGPYAPFLKARITSLEKQLEFMRPRLAGKKPL